VQRHVTRWTPEGGDTEAVAKQAIALLCSFPGTLNLYQGEEFGQEETDILFEELQDTANIAFWPSYKGRDGCRTPMVWDHEAPNGGFTTGTPWLPVKAPQLAHALSLQGNDGVLAAYRETLAFRRARDELRLGQTGFADLPEPLLGIVRSVYGHVVTGVFNLSDEARVVHFTGRAKVVGPHAVTVKGHDLHLPAHGFVFLASATVPGLKAV
jgi:alpha-glucosidase